MFEESAENEMGLDITDAPAIMASVRELWQEVEDLVAKVRESRALTSDGGRKLTAEEWSAVAAESLEVAQAANKTAMTILRAVND